MPLHGSTDLGENVTTYGAVVNFTCAATHRLVGLSSVRCEADGRWSGDSPRCRSMKFVIFWLVL